MPWNDQSNPGPWGSPPNNSGEGKHERPQDDGPRPGPRRRGPPPPRGGPGLEALLRRLEDYVRRFMGGAGGRGVRPSAVGAVLVAAAVLWALSGVYIVQPDEQAVVTTFGSYSRSADPGLNYHLPSPIEKVEKVSVTSLNRIDIGGVAGAENPKESLMLTGDENIVDLNFSVQWRINDAAAYLFNIRDQEEAVKAVAESAMREVVGKTALQVLLTSGRGTVQDETTALMQKILDSYGAGITVVAVQIRTANPPAEVVAAFRDVANAGQDAESAVNEANTYKNRVVNEAKGDASKIVQSAQGYREQIVRTAEGDTSRFNQVYAEYKRAPAVTRQRLYLETMQRVLAKSNKVIVEGKTTSAPIILPPDVFKPRAAAPTGEAALAPQATTANQAPAPGATQ